MPIRVCCVAIVVLLLSCRDEEEGIRSISIIPELQIAAGDIQKLLLSTNPYNTPGAEFRWTSKDTGIATVDTDGVVTALNAGTTWITVYLSADNDVYSTCRVVVLPPPGNWTSLPDFGDPNGVEQATGFAIGNKIYVATGYSTGDRKLKASVWEYNIDTNAWKKLQDFPGGARSLAIAFSIAGKGYLGLGTANGQPKSDFWEYDPLAGTWTQLQDFPGGPRAGALGIAVANRGYVGLGLGVDLLQSHKDFWEFDPDTDIWKQRADFPGGGSRDATGFSIDQFAYVGMGGYNDLWRYDPANDSWLRRADLFDLLTKQLGSFGTPGRSYACAFSLDGKGYLGMGISSTAAAIWPIYRHDFNEYDPEKDEWKPVAFCPFPATHVLAFAVGSQAFIGTGHFQRPRGNHEYDYTTYRSWYKFTP